MTKITTKLQVTKDVKEAFDTLLVHTSNWTNSEIIDQVVRCGGFMRSDRKVLNALPIENLVQALFVGYEEPAPKGLMRVAKSNLTATGVESLVERFKRTEGSDMYSYSDGVRDGIKRALAELQLDIIGINKN